MAKSKLIQVFEHATLKVDDNSLFTQAHFNALEQYGYKTKEKYYRVGNRRIKFSQYVGIIHVNNLTIEVLPKADNLPDSSSQKEKWRNALLDMLHECRLIQLESISNAKLKLVSHSLLEIYFDLFLTRTEKIVRQGFRKKYRPIQQNLNKVKGKIMFTQNIRKNMIHREQFFVEHTLYDVNNRLNQILLKALLILQRTTYNSDHIIRINKLLLEFENVDEHRIDEKWFDRINYDRNTQRYRNAIELAKLIILHYSPDLKGGDQDVLAILFDMNLLFENYVYRKLKSLQFEDGNQIRFVKDQTRRPFWESRGIRADILLETEEPFRNIVIDTKWKVLHDHKPSDADLKQMFVYNLHYNSQLSILMYPKVNLSSVDKRPFKHIDYKDTHCQLAFVDIFNGDRLDRNLGHKIYKEYLSRELDRIEDLNIDEQ